jgi:glutamate-1-semialdehyde 2,1-aminomutase
MSIRYNQSEALLERALKVIPLGSQTFSKSLTQYPYGVSPYFVVRGEGSRVWDADGNEYIDFINGLASITLGYKDPDVTAAVKAQLDEGVIFSLPHPIEIKVAETLCSMVPCADMVRFGKNGSDATTGAVRLARAFTGRDHIAVCGYHGWQDWYIGTTARNRGVPKAVSELTHVFPYNDLPALEQLFKKFPGEFAAVIMEPMNVMEPAPGYLESVKELAHKHGALLVFDETITGFRYSNGGAQEMLGVTPDLATFGKGLANGYPLSALAGRGDVMSLMEEIFFSFTFGGEALSLAAAHATMNKLKSCPVVDTLSLRGKRLIIELKNLIEKHGLSDYFSVVGHPSWSFLLMKDVGAYSQWQIKTYFLQEMFARGILTLGTHNLSYAHSEADIDLLIETYNTVLPLIGHAIRAETLEAALMCKPLEPLFKVR